MGSKARGRRRKGCPTACSSAVFRPLRWPCEIPQPRARSVNATLPLSYSAKQEPDLKDRLRGLHIRQTCLRKAQFQFGGEDLHLAVRVTWGLEGGLSAHHFGCHFRSAARPQDDRWSASRQSSAEPFSQSPCEQ